jgi:hypothetical protein
MLTDEKQIKALIKQGKGLNLEFKTCLNQLNRDVYPFQFKKSEGYYSGNGYVLVPPGAFAKQKYIGSSFL